jgi:hypothetical protein
MKLGKAPNQPFWAFHVPEWYATTPKRPGVLKRVLLRFARIWIAL